ncbi:GDSL family lipase [Paenibacillus sp. FSL R7-0273]|uniref:SGNH/GDSL hydrolase family protein n=1 Tax=Paenibacillus sp. FSL R7-0273 TaxID=1536772 RepID=UPI0004F593AD|nr:SGNH/GDSL hydrolase family protein [Paenibacillus sp. FSL R7-0273]AIQ49970.1 GDSL family lipase [Paenibacillus sp. FSL R7-0273]OMF84545.1 GDSL family lipase [Paenibacillus sp. FSL R7-0273]
MKENGKLQAAALSEVSHLKVHGRSNGSLAPLTLFWTGSAVEFNIRGSELWIEAEADYDQHEPWIGIVINGFAVSRQMLTAGRRWICVFRGMNGNTVKNVRIVRELQAMSDDPGCLLQLHAVRSDGEFLPVADKALKLEFIGDSITSGEGVMGSKTEEDWIPVWFSATDSYTALTAELLEADYRVISQSGWGVLTSWDNNPSCNIPRYYSQVCGLLGGERNEALGALQENDFEAWQPDAVIINLGTNDGGAFYSPEWTDPASGIARKQRLNEDGSFNEHDLEAFEKAAESFLVKLRQCNPQAHLVWAYGMLGIPMLPAIRRAVDSYISATGDNRVSVFQLPDMTPESAGARSHPGRLAHEQAAQALSGYLLKLLQ